VREAWEDAGGCIRQQVADALWEWLYCRSVEDCVEEILRDYKREVEKMRGRLFTQPGGGASAEVPRARSFRRRLGQSVGASRPGEVGGDCRGYAQVPVDGGGGEAEASRQPPPLHGITFSFVSRRFARRSAGRAAAVLLS
jgi:hypothetical protein